MEQSLKPRQGNRAQDRDQERLRFPRTNLRHAIRTADLADAAVTPVDAAKAARRKEAEERNAALVKALLEGAPESEIAYRELAGQLVDFHKREAKPEWWAMFNREDMTEEELIDDAECIGGLEADPDRLPFPEKRSIVYSFRFPAQDFKMRLGGDVLIADTRAPAGEIFRLNEETFEISLKRGKNRDPLPHRFSLIPKGPLGDQVLRAAIARYIGPLVKGHEDQYAAITGILRRDYPRLQDQTSIGDDADEVTRAIDAIERLDHSHLLIQGPRSGQNLHGLSCDRRNACPWKSGRSVVALA